MIKSVFKEIVIILLLILAILLLLGILFYDYMPSSKIVPAKVEEYAMDEETKTELEKELNNAKSEEVVKTYMLDAIDLAGYEKTKEYNKGKQNPFADYSNGNTGTTTQTNYGGTGNSGNSNQNGTSNSGTTGNGSNSNTSTGTFLNVVGK